MAIKLLTNKEEKELKILRELQANSRRWFTQEEFDRLKELNKKQMENSKPYNVC